MMARWEFEAIYKAFSRMVYWAAYGVTKSESDAGDVTQETFIRALKYADKSKAGARRRPPKMGGLCHDLLAL